ncbi:MAG: FmdE family protein [Methanobrevibacter sp.]|jgi:formylmethanofuran dehydrogenase subunit E|nr:FmdE family protein [Candidatus Methanovirga aequatorialis]
MSDEKFEEQLKKVKEFHGHLDGGTVIGTKMTMYAFEKLGLNLNEENEDLMVFVEIGRCVADAIQSVSGSRVGKKTFKLMDYGRHAATFCRISTGEGIRVVDEDIKNQNRTETDEELIERLTNTPNEELFSIQKIKIDFENMDHPDKKFNRIVCPVCNEVVKDNKYVVRNGVGICKACAEESYYQIIN